VSTPVGSSPPADRLLPERAPPGHPLSERALSERVPSARPLSEWVSSERALSGRPLSERALSEPAPSDRVVSDRPLIGVLALQGDFAAHARLLGGLGAAVREVRVPADLDGIAGLVLPGGESTTMTLGIRRERLADPLRAVVAAGTPVLATCAGLIILDRDHLGLLDIRAQRNAFGRQVRSFETDLSLAGFSRPVRAVFIRAPWVVEHGPGVQVLGQVDGHVIAVRQAGILAAAFHPELAGETQLHEWLLAQVAAASAGPAASGGAAGPA
jgi:pyridoxal 5'-phosphate synthase pdxT subunit